MSEHDKHGLHILEHIALRDYFAGQALPAVIAAYVHGNGNCIGTDHIERNVPIIAYKFADAMLKSRQL